MFIQNVIIASVLLISQFDHCVLQNKHDNLGERLSGRNAAPPGAFPFQVSLRNNSNVHFCGGALISERWVLSAASCVYNKLANEILIVVGAESIRDGTIHTCENVTSHEQFDVSTRQNNIAVLKTSRDVLNSTVVRPTFYYRGPVTCSYNYTLSGWGGTEKRDDHFLQYLNVTTITNKVCNALFSGYNSTEIFLNGLKLCVLGSLSGGTIICHGDEGAPLFSVRGMVVVGIVSYSSCTESVPGIVTVLFYCLNFVLLIYLTNKSSGFPFISCDHTSIET